MIQQYVAAFKKCYPQAQVKVSPFMDRKERIMKFWVYINGDKGSYPLSEDQLASATRMLEGKPEIPNAMRQPPKGWYSLQERARM